MNYSIYDLYYIQKVIHIGVFASKRHNVNHRTSKGMWFHGLELINLSFFIERGIFFVYRHFNYLLGGNMNNKKKVAFQSQRISDLNERIKSLEGENKAMANDIERYKKLILLKDKTIKDLTKAVSKAEVKASKELQDVIAMKKELAAGIANLRNLEQEYTKKQIKLIKRLKTQ